ncbi:Structural maintenance of chromosomes protein 5 [Grifola frondosa]|uniref:Structural maintenance of chromosomes protein 5 n=1 Tax=Grifola frondosa TaxID=5627 RepID=A0A1C7M5Y6_GRIFR|nr:Structural maintenance of chromosomes protein 5 [Grifola frondosa]
MARRVVSKNTDDSQKENSGVARRPAMEKNHTQERTTRSTRAMREHVAVPEEDDKEEEEEIGGGPADEEDKDDDQEVEEEQEEQGPEDDDDDEEDASPKGRKRVRVNGEGDSRPSSSSLKDEKKARLQTLPRDVDGFVPGAIVRVQLKNFVTYDFVEFRPGPYLNMIFGPNGTGKSTIACAICLGLNFPPSVLGRASELNSFVKIGTDSGYIEIELKGKKGKSNLVMRRTLSANSKSSTFTLNGRSATGREINTQMAELNVQVSNLCTFLPQDKVSEFARMSPQQLLRETQRAAGDEHLTSWHDTLISKGKELKQVQELVNADRDQLKTMEERNANLERDVKRYEERRAIERKIDLLELILPFREYMEAKERYETAKAEQRRLHEHVKALQKKNTPTLDLKKSLERRLKEREEHREAKKAATKHKFQVMRKKWTENETLEGQADDLKARLANLKVAEKNRLRDIQKLEKAIAAAQNQIDNPPEIEDLQDLNNQLKQLNQEHNNTKARQSELQDRQRANVNEESRAKYEVNQNMQRLQQLEDASHRKLEDLGRWDKDCAEVVVWLRKNRERFKMEIFEPVQLCLTVPNKNYVHAVESCFGGAQLKTFVAQCEEDYQLLNTLIVDTPQGIGRKARINTWFKVKNESRLPPPPMSEEEMRQLGFDGYAINYIDCPEGLKWYLQSEVRLHRTAISLDAGRVDPNRAMEMVARTGGATYIIGNVVNTVTRSKYGKRLPQNSTKEVRQAKILVNSAIDPQVKRGLDAALAEARVKLQLCKEESEKLSVEDHEIQAAHKAYKDAYDGINVRKKTVVAQQSHLLSLKAKIESNQDRLDRLRNAPPVDTERGQLKNRLLANARKRADLVKEYTKLVRGAIKEQKEATRVGLEYLQILANKSALEQLWEVQEQEYRQALAEFNDAHKLYEAAKLDSRAKLAVSKEKLDSVDDEIRDQFGQMERSGEANEKTSEEVETELQTQRAQLEMNLHTNPGVVEQYKKRKAEIEALSNIIEEREEKVEKIERSIKIARDNWQPTLERLVASIGKKFSAAFDRIGCAGEIRVSEHEDFDKWAIDIMVKFRDDEKLQLLTGERQSGGERSLTTILYLMSLTEEARAPFSLVDEINQGMDQRAERAVHNSLVEVTCKEDSGQYFLITPKLLPDLKYHERMKVLCVNNGEWLLEETGTGSMIGLIEGFVNRNRSNAAA